jgi:serine protease
MRHDKTLAATGAAALLAACGGGGANTLPSAQAPTGTHTQSAGRHLTMLSKFSAVGDNGAILRVLPPREALGHEALGVGGTSPSPLLYGGGPVQTAPHLYGVFWVSAWNSSSGDANVIQAPLKTFFGAIGHSWINSVAQYTQSNGQHAGNADNIFIGSYVDATSSPLPVPQDSDIAAEAVKAAAHFGDYSPSAAYVVALPHNTIPVGFRVQYCAWHSSTAAAGGTIAYTNLPYMPDAGSSCGQGSVNTPGTIDGVSIVAGHEQGETESDPFPSTGWTDASGAENGDKCAWTGLQNNPNAGGFPTQPLWSNAGNGGLGACVQSY